MTATPTHYDYSIPPSPILPPVPCVSRASSSSSLSSLYDLHSSRLPSFQYGYSDDEGSPRTPEETFFSMSKSSLGFTEDELVKAFQDRADVLTASSPGGRLAHDVSDPQSPWKRSIRLRYSDVNMRDSNTLALHEASQLLSKDMSSYVFARYNPV
jgi:hypothetical protein